MSMAALIFWGRLWPLCWVGLYSWSAAAQADAEPVATAIRAELDTLMSTGEATIRGARIAMGARLHEFYSLREFRAAWGNAESQRQLLQALADTYHDGLDPADYHLPLLQKLATQVAASGATDALRAQYDVLLTESLLRVAYHLGFGKVDPESFDAQWNYGRTLPEADLSQEIEQAIASGAVYERLSALKPRHYLYERLKRELARYRGIDADGGWPALPAGSALRPGDRGARVPVLRHRLVRSGDLLEAPVNDVLVYDAPLVAAVKQYQARLGLDADAVVGAATIAELNVPVAQRISQLRVNLDRGRVLLQDLPDRFVVVNIAGYTVYLVTGQQVTWSARAQVGRAYRRTPLFRSNISYLVFNPTWTVPPGIIAADILPAARNDPGSIARRGLRVLGPDGRELDPAAIDWSRFRSGHIPYTLRQDSGPSNALGRIKFMFPNPYLVYLHDTPSQSLFERAERPFSSGCVRVERALELAQLVLNDSDGWNQDAIARVVASGQLRNVTLKTKIPVLLVYWTAWVDAQGLVNFRRDLYGQDAAWERALNAPFKLRARPLFAESSRTTHPSL
ncbi:MAG TPA: L,D-transpeptidase family protein [Steroidobacteraceae bacterium]|nr:L,D-transpeptidase family protein [Steroidobacteraceae bacterium]